MTDLDAQRRKFDKELATGTVALVLLAILGRDGEPMYGYQIAKRFEQADEAALAGKQSTLYPVLRNLAAAGLLARGECGSGRVLCHQWPFCGAAAACRTRRSLLR